MQRARWIVARAAIVGSAVALGALVVGSVSTTAPADLATDQQEAHQLAAQLAVLDSQVQIAAERYDQATFQLAQDQAQLAAVRKRLDAQERELARLRGQLAAAAVREFATSGTAEPMAALLEGTPTTAAIVATDVQVASSTEAQLAASYSAALQATRAERTQLTTLVRQAASVAQTAGAARAEAERAQAAVQSELASLQGQLAQLVAEAEAAQAAQRERAAAAQLASQTAPAAVPAPVQVAGGALAEAASIAEAIAQRGNTGYAWGAAGSWAGGVQYFDCSGLVMYVFAQVGISLPHDAAAQYADSTPIGYGQLVPGDLVFYDTLGSSSIDHVAIYVGGGQVVEATEPGRPVAVDPMAWSGTPVAYAQP